MSLDESDAKPLKKLRRQDATPPALIKEVFPKDQGTLESSLTEAQCLVRIGAEANPQISISSRNPSAGARNREPNQGCCGRYLRQFQLDTMKRLVGNPRLPARLGVLLPPDENAVALTDRPQRCGCGAGVTYGLTRFTRHDLLFSGELCLRAFKVHPSKDYSGDREARPQGAL